MKKRIQIRQERSELRLKKLETLAAQLCSDLWKQNPNEAIRAAKKLLDVGNHEAWHTVLRTRAVEADKEQEGTRSETAPRGFAEGLEAITERGNKKQRLSREKEHFEGFLLSEHGTKAKANAALKRFENEGFTAAEVEELRKLCRVVAAKEPQKGKQGRVKNREKDPRVKPRAVAMPEFGKKVLRRNAR